MFFYFFLCFSASLLLVVCSAVPGISARRAQTPGLSAPAWHPSAAACGSCSPPPPPPPSLAKECRNTTKSREKSGKRGRGQAGLLAVCAQACAMSVFVAVYMSGAGRAFNNKSSPSSFLIFRKQDHYRLRSYPVCCFHFFFLLQRQHKGGAWAAGRHHGAAGDAGPEHAAGGRGCGRLGARRRHVW